jgi:PAS domain S-box-containing protein
MELHTELRSVEPAGLESGLRHVLAAFTEGFVSLDADWRVTECNSATERLLGRSRGELIGRNFFAAAGLAHESPLARLARRVASAQKPEDAELSYERDGRARLIAVRAFPFDGGVAAVWREITVARAAERRLALSIAQYRELTDGIPTAAWLSRADGELEFINQAMADTLGRDRRALLGNGWIDCLDPDDREQLLRVRAQARENNTGFHYEGRFRRPDGALRIIELDGRPRFDAVGAFRGHVGVAADLTVTREAERRQQLLINELNHRVKNTLAIVQSLVRCTLKENEVPVIAANAVADRLIALAAAHDVLSRELWENAELSDVIAEAMRPYGGRVAAAGPNVRVAPKTVIALAMGLGELATNAAKHGALSTIDGRVELRWSTRDGLIDLEWREQGGPPVASPQITGFGSFLLGQALVVELGRPAEITYAPDGLICRLWAPAAGANDRSGDLH